MSSIKTAFVKHGTLTAYQQFHCRCEQCRMARRDYDRKRREAEHSGTQYAKRGAWSAREHNYVAETMNLPLQTVADHLKRPRSNVSGMRYMIRREKLMVNTIDGPANEKAHWTYEELQALRIMFERGDSDYKMARVLGRSPRAIQRKRLQINLKRRIS